MKLHEQIAQGSPVYRGNIISIYNAELRINVGPYGRGTKFDYIELDYNNSEVSFYKNTSENDGNHIKMFGTNLILDTVI